MTTYSCEVGGTTRVKALAPGVKVLEKTLDLYQLGVDEVASGNVFTAADVIKALNVPANTLVMRAGIVCHTAEGDTMTLDLGDGDDVDGYVDGYDAESTGGSASASALGYGPDGIFYTSADTIDLVIATVGAQTSHSAVVTVWAIVAQILGDV